MILLCQTEVVTSLSHSTWILQVAVDDTGPGEQKQNDEESETPSSTTWNETKDLTDPKLLEDKNTNIKIIV